MVLTQRATCMSASSWLHPQPCREFSVARSPALSAPVFPSHPPARKMAAERSIKKRIAAALARSGYTVVDSPDEPLKIHSHCAGMDAVASSFKLLGITIKSLATEADVTPAIFHLMHHRDKTEHLVADVKWVARGLRGPCFLHGGKMCQLDRGGWQLVFSSFVCKSYTRASDSRVKSMTADEEDPRGVDTYHHTKTTIKKYLPAVFVLENVANPVGMSMDPAIDNAATTKTESHAFMAKIADPAVGGTYMTLLMTLSNLGGMWCNSFVLWFVDQVTVK